MYKLENVNRAETGPMYGTKVMCSIGGDGLVRVVLRVGNRTF